MRLFEERNAYFDALFNNKTLRWLGQNTNHYPTHSSVRKAMIECIDSEEFHGYAPPAGIEELRSLILSDLDLQNASVLVTDGAIEGLYHACHTFVGKGDELIATDPGWKWPVVFAEALGARAMEIPIYDEAAQYKLTVNQLAAAVTPRTRLIYLTDPNNPLGTRYSAEELKAFTDIARSVDAHFVHDCTYRDFADDHVLAFPFYPEKTIVTYSFSKWLGLAGLRIGAIVAHPQVIEELAKAPPNNLGCSVLAQRAAIAGLKIKKEWFPGIKRAQRENQRLVREAVQKVEGLRIPVFPSHGNFLVIDCKQAELNPDVLVELYQELGGILIRQGAYHSKRNAGDFIKVSTTAPCEWIEEFCSLLPKVIEQARGRLVSKVLY